MMHHRKVPGQHEVYDRLESVISGMQREDGKRAHELLERHRSKRDHKQHAHERSNNTARAQPVRIWDLLDDYKREEPQCQVVLQAIQHWSNTSTTIAMDNQHMSFEFQLNITIPEAQEPKPIECIALGKETKRAPKAERMREWQRREQEQYVATRRDVASSAGAPARAIESKEAASTRENEIVNGPVIDCEYFILTANSTYMLVRCQGRADIAEQSFRGQRK